MRNWFTAQELVGLPGMPGTDRNVRLLAEREGWEGQRRLGSKAIEYNFAQFPVETQTALLARLVQQGQVELLLRIGVALVFRYGNKHV